MRCPDCNKFVPYDTEIAPEVGSEEVEHSIDDGKGTAQIIVEVRRVLTCENCGTELKDCTFDFSEEIEVCACVNEDGIPTEMDTEVEAHPTTRMQTHDRAVRVITSPRYRKTYYGVDICGAVKCPKCLGDWAFQESQDLEASAFDELT